MPYDVFINYRRDDTLAMAVVLEIFLNNSFSNLQVFLDQEGIEAEKWTKKLEQALEESSVVITLIGHKYLDVRNEHGERRIDLDDDWVRKEIEIAVDRKKTIIPVLVDGAKMLSKEAFKKWPKLQEWLEWQAETVAWKTFNDDFEKLVTTIEKQSGRKRKQSGAVASPINPLDAYPLPEINPLDPDEEDQVLGGIVRTTPYLGLRYFRRKDAALFFGRSEELLKFFGLVKNPQVRIICLFGNTGVGKSSFLAAGVRPRLERMAFEPFYARRNKVTGFDGQLTGLQQNRSDSSLPAIYILDQAEEMFTDPVRGEQERFVSALAKLLEGEIQSTVVLGFRSDYLMEMRELLKMLFARVLVDCEEIPLLPLTQAALREAVEGVWLDSRLRKAFSLELEEGFADYVARDLLQTETGSTTSVLQNRLLKLYEEGSREKKSQIRLTIENYQELKKDNTAEEELLDYQLQRLQAEDGVPLPDERIWLETLQEFVLDKPTAGSLLVSKLPADREAVRRALLRVNLLSEITEPDKALRLSHDLLAPVVRRRYDALTKLENQGLKLENLELLLRQIRAALPELKFDDAASDLEQSVLLGVHPGKLAPVAFELGFVYLQAGKEEKGVRMASVYGQLMRETDAILPPFSDKSPLEWLRYCNVAHYQQLELRYFPEMKPVPGGRFEMGDVMGDGEYDDEMVHSVLLNSYRMGATPVTWHQYGLYCLATGLELPQDSGWGRADRPVINVSWYDAVEYANWLSGKKGLQPSYVIDKTKPDTANKDENENLKWTVNIRQGAGGYRLPTESEWEYAAREGGRAVRFGNGKDVANPAEMNFDASEAYKKEYSRIGVYRSQTTPVEQFRPNALGLYDMSGNVREWCWDWYGQYETEFRENPQGAAEGDTRVFRGGSWFYVPQFCRAAYRIINEPSNRNFSLGFRLAVSLQ